MGERSVKVIDFTVALPGLRRTRKVSGRLHRRTRLLRRRLAMRALLPVYTYLMPPPGRASTELRVPPFWVMVHVVTSISGSMGMTWAVGFSTITFIEPV